MTCVWSFVSCDFLIAMTPFEKKVYKAVLEIPLGEVRSYEWVARRAGSPRSCRAVGQALKKNPYTVLIPCHRVVRSDRSLGGYSGGIRKKKMLLELERKIRAQLEE